MSTSGQSGLLTEPVMGAAHPLAHHFDSPQQQYEASKLGMWLFLATEILLFGGLFCLYAIFRGNHPEMFAYGHRFLDVGWGAINTAVLIFSSLTMALAVWAAQAGARRDLVLYLALTLLGAVNFLGIKIVEYRHKFHDHLMWGAAFYAPQHASPEAPAPAADQGDRATGAEQPAAAAPLAPGDAVRGRDLYRNTCASCHGTRGEGVAGQGKDIRGSAFIQGLDDAALLAFIKRGRLPRDPDNTTGRMMPARGGNPMLTDDHLIDIIARLREIVKETPAAAEAPPANAGEPHRHGAPPGTNIAPEVEPSRLDARSVIPPAAAGPAGLAPDWNRSKPEEPLYAPPMDPRRDPERPANLHIFFGIYFCMTGLHGLHVLIGAGVIGWLLVRTLRGEFTSDYFTPVDLGGLYWHVVDLIWIFLFPLLYLIA